MKITRETKFLIVGLGLIGGSYARALIKQGYEVSAITRSQESIDYALAEKIISKGTTEVTEEFVKDADIVVFALYPKILIKWLEEYQQFLKPGVLITDVTGVKGEVIPDIQKILRKDVEFIGAHPMAGREVYGVENSDDRIFHGANYIVTPTSENTPEAIETCKELGRILGFARISELSPDNHDEMIGFVSQLTHAIAVALMTCNDNEHLVDYTGDSFRDLTRIARINEDMWSELFLMNKGALIDQIDCFQKELSAMRELISTENQEGLKEKMRLSTQRRKLFDK